MSITQEQLAKILEENNKTLVSQFLIVHQESLQKAIPQIVNASAEKTTAFLATTLQELQVKVNQLEGVVVNMATKKTTPKKVADQAPVATGASTDTAPQPAAATTQPAIKAPVLPGSFSNRSLFLKHYAKTENDAYTALVGNDLIAIGRTSPGYLGQLQKTPIETATADQLAVLRGYEATAIFAELKKPANKAVQDKVGAAMAAYNARLAPSAKVETIEKIE